MVMASVYLSPYSEAFSLLPFTDGEMHSLSLSTSSTHISDGCSFNARSTSDFDLKKVCKSWLNLSGYIPLKLGQNVKLE